MRGVGVWVCVCGNSRALCMPVPAREDVWREFVLSHHVVVDTSPSTQNTTPHSQAHTHTHTARLTPAEHFCTTVPSSVDTISTHFSAGCNNFLICLLTISSNAISGVNNPTLWGNI